MKIDTISICKKPERINDAARIDALPERMKPYVQALGNGEYLVDNTDAPSKKLKVKSGAIVCWEPTADPALNGWNLWHSTTTVEIEGEFFSKGNPVRADLVSDEAPFFTDEKFLSDEAAKLGIDEFERAKPIRKEDGSWELETTWGTVAGKPGDIWAFYGINRDDENAPYRVDANLIAVAQDATIQKYYLCTADGVIIEPLADYLARRK